MSKTKWQQPQNWIRDTDQPCVSLGKSGDFDDMHLFALCVAFENGEYRLWYPGSRGDVEERVFKLGLAISTDGIRFTKHPNAPVYEFGNGKNSVLTPTLLRNPDGSLLRENGKLRMWFASTTLKQATHTPFTKPPVKMSSIGHHPLRHNFQNVMRPPSSKKATPINFGTMMSHPTRGFIVMPKAQMVKIGRFTQAPSSNWIKLGNMDAYFIPPFSKPMVYI